MKNDKLFGKTRWICGLWLVGLPLISQAAPLDEVSLQQQGDVVQATIKMTTPIHFVRYVPGEKSRIVEIYYERIPSSDKNEVWQDKEVRNSPATALTPAFSVTTRDQATQPKLVVEFASEVSFSVNAGSDSRSFVVTIKPEKTDVTQAVELPLLPTVLPPVAEKAGTPAVEGAASAAENNQEGYKLMLAGRDALSAKNYSAATEAFNKLLLLPPNQYSQDAQEWVGVSRERGEQTAKAKAEYELYLKLYTSGPGPVRVKQRLAGLVLPTATVKMDAAPKKIEPRSFVQGGISSHYYYGKSDIEATYQYNNTTETTKLSLQDQSSLISTVDASGRYINETYDNRIVVRDVHTKNLLSGQTDRNRLNSAYIEVKNRDVDYSLRVGRQTSNGGGVMGRFDGVAAGYGSAQDYRVNGVVGQLVDFTSTTQPTFYGFSVDSGPVSAYVINQTIEGVQDRQAVGAEYRYFEDAKTAYAMIDYDFYFSLLNAAMLTGSYGIESTGTTFNLMADYRKSPAVSTRNALNGAATTLVADLLAAMSDAQLKQLAIDRTGSSTYSQFGVTQKLNATWQAGADIKLTQTSGLPASGTTTLQGVLAATPDTGLEKTVTGQLIASNLYSDADITSIGGSYITSGYVQGAQSMFVYNRTSLDKELYFDTSWNFYRQSDNYGGSMSRNVPMVRVSYQVQQSLNLDADVGVELTTSAGTYQTTTTQRVFGSVGFRWDF